MPVSQEADPVTEQTPELRAQTRIYLPTLLIYKVPARLIFNKVTLEDIEEQVFLYFIVARSW